MSLLLLIVILANTCRPVRNKTRLMVEITNGNTSVKITLKTLTLCPTYWEVKIPKSVEQITVAGIITPIVKFDWDEFQVINKLSNQELYIEKLYRVNLLTGKKIRRIMSTTSCVYFFMEHQKLYIPLQNW